VNIYNPISGKPLFQQEKDVQNVDKTKPKRASVTQELQKSVFRRIDQDVNEWRQALRRAEDPWYPDRRRLIRVYNDIILESHTKTVVSTRVENVLAMPFKISRNGETSDELTELMQSRWFIEFLRLAIESQLFGPTLVEFGSIVEDAFSEVKEVPRRFLLPERREFRKSDDMTTGTSIDQPPYDAWTLMLGEPDNLGELNAVAPVSIIKKATIGSWAEYNEAYGVPIAIAKTVDTESEDNMRQMRSMLENLPDTRWGIFDADDELQIVEPSVGTQSTFKDLIELANDEISKALLGQTMTTEDGSSRSQGEVHERVMQTYTASDKRYVAAIVNDQLIPLMQRHGILPEGVKFEWDEAENLSLKEQWEIDKVLVQTQGYQVDPEYIQEKYGTPVTFQGRTSGPAQADAELASIENASVSDFHAEAIANAKKALEFVRQNRGRGDKKAKQIARRVARKEPIGRHTLKEVTSYAAYEQYAERSFEESDASLNFYLVGGKPMVRDYAPLALQSVKAQDEIAKNILANVERRG